MLARPAGWRGCWGRAGRNRIPLEAVINYYPFHVGDYIAHTAHLDPLEDIAYRRLLDLYYMQEMPLPKDAAKLARLIRMEGYTEIVDAVLTEFFSMTEHGWSHKRCNIEIKLEHEKGAGFLTFKLMQDTGSISITYLAGMDLNAFIAALKMSRYRLIT